MASRSVTPCASVALRLVVWNTPAQAAEEDSVVGKRVPLLVAEGEHVDAVGPAQARVDDLLQREDAEHHAHGAVTPAGVGDGVDVRADQQARRLGPGRVPVPAHRAQRVLAHLQPGLAHPSADEVGGAAVLRREEEAGEVIGLAEMAPSSSIIACARAPSAAMSSATLMIPTATPPALRRPVIPCPRLPCAIAPGRPLWQLREPEHVP